MSSTHEVRGVGHSVKRKEDARFLRGKGQYFDDITLPGMLHMEILRSPYAHARINSIDTSAASALPGVVAVVTGELMAQHNLAWMPTLSGDTQAVLVTDKVRFQGQEVACVIAESAYIAKDALELIEVDYEPLPAVTSPQQSSSAGRPADPGREGRPDDEPRLPLGDRRQGRDRPRLLRGRPRRRARHLLPPLPPGAARMLRLHRRRQPGDGQGDDLPDLPGAARPPHPVRDRRGTAGAADPDHQPRHRRRLRQQGADLPGLRRRDRCVAPDRQAGEVGRGPHRQPDLDRVRPRLPHARGAGDQGREDDGAARFAPVRPGGVLRGRPAHEVPGRAVPHRHRLLRHPRRARRGGRLVHEQGARRRRLPLLVPCHRGVVPDRAPRRQTPPTSSASTRRSSGSTTSSSPSSSRTSRRPGSSTTPATTRRRCGSRSRSSATRTCAASRRRRARRGACSGSASPPSRRWSARATARTTTSPASRCSTPPSCGCTRRARRSSSSACETQGQGHETTFAQIVAEELGIPLRGRGGAGGRHRQHAVRPRHLREPLDAGRRRGHDGDLPQAAREGEGDRGAPPRGVGLRHRVRGRPLLRARGRPSSPRRSRTSPSPPTRTFPTAWSPASKASTTTTRRT